MLNLFVDCKKRCCCLASLQLCPATGTITVNRDRAEVTEEVGSWAECSELCRLELQTKVQQRFAITEKAPSRALSWFYLRIYS